MTTFNVVRMTEYSGASVDVPGPPPPPALHVVMSGDETPEALGHPDVVRYAQEERPVSLRLAVGEPLRYGSLAGLLQANHINLWNLRVRL